MSSHLHPHLAPGSVVVVRDEEWLVRATEDTADGLLVHVQGLGELVRDTTASFYAGLDDDRRRSTRPTATVVADDSPQLPHARGCGWSRRSARPRCRSATAR